ncbi:MAG TPA: hypothetical protein VG247_08280 [Pseudonocardiaceae bacterium]|nr:hypothetical protein [Pseudonocardiaceae bacterium]
MAGDADAVTHAAWQVMVRRRQEIARIVNRMPVRQRYGLTDASGEPPVYAHDGSTEWI